jgi:hypothetical protein
MKIIIIGTAYPFRGGLAAYNERLARQFSEEGHEVSIRPSILRVHLQGASALKDV